MTRASSGLQLHEVSEETCRIDVDLLQAEDVRHAVDEREDISGSMHPATIRPCWTISFCPYQNTLYVNQGTFSHVKAYKN